jgi:hypothetical protein
MVPDTILVNDYEDEVYLRVSSRGRKKIGQIGRGFLPRVPDSNYRYFGRGINWAIVESRKVKQIYDGQQQ